MHYSDNHTLQQAFNAGVAFAIGRNRVLMACDEVIFRTAENKKKYMLDTESGMISGLGNKIKAYKPKSEVKASKQQSQNTNTKSIDLNHPDKIDKSLIIQNRDRSNMGSLQQINSIASKPDYDALAPSRDFANGAPVVAYGSIPENQLGKVTRARASDGTKYDVQYAVIDAGDCLTSHDAHGTENSDYFSDDASKIRAIAGNGRMTGMQEAYKRGNANEYKAELMADSDHGINPDIIKNMKAPVLVRVMQAKDVTSDIGDKSNTTNNLSMTATEKAVNDSHRVDFSKFKTDEDGEPTSETIKSFVSQMPLSEQGELLNKDGEPTRQALRRLQDASFAKAYENDRLINLYTQEIEPKARNILKSLELASLDMAKLKGLNDGYDIRDLVSNAVSEHIKAIKNGVRGQTDMFSSSQDNETVKAIDDLFYKYSRSPRELGDRLRKLAKACYQEGSKTEKTDLFGMPSQKPLGQILRDIAKDAKRPLKMSDKALKFWHSQGGKLINSIVNDDARTTKRLFKTLKQSI